MANAPQQGHDLVDTTAVQLLGVGIFTILAGTDDDLGDVMVIVMWGILFAWILLHVSQLVSWTPASWFPNSKKPKVT